MNIIKHIFKSKSKLSFRHNFVKFCVTYKFIGENQTILTEGQNLANSRQELYLSTNTDNIVKLNIRF